MCVCVCLCICRALRPHVTIKLLRCTVEPHVFSYSLSRYRLTCRRPMMDTRLMSWCCAKSMSLFHKRINFSCNERIQRVCTIQFKCIKFWIRRTLFSLHTEWGQTSLGIGKEEKQKKKWKALWQFVADLYFNWIELIRCAVRGHGFNAKVFTIHSECCCRLMNRDNPVQCTCSGVHEMTATRQHAQIGHDTLTRQIVVLILFRLFVGSTIHLISGFSVNA